MVGALLLKSIARTLRWESDGSFEREWGPIGGTRPLIIVFWHDRQLMLFPIYWLKGRAKHTNGLCALTSRHADGLIISGILNRIGIRTVNGSSSRGGAIALRALSAVVGEGWDAAITPDGPKGPRHEAKDGAVKLAQLTGALISPICYTPQRRWTFKSWDKMFLPKPFTRAVAKAAPLIDVPKDMTDEQFTRIVAQMQQSLRAVTEDCERHEFR